MKHNPGWCQELPNRREFRGVATGLSLQRERSDQPAALAAYLNYGHGKQNLSVVLALLMMLAFLVDQVQQACCPLFQATWNKMKTKCHLWEEIRNCFQAFRFDSMTELLTALIRGIERQRPVLVNTS
jgi:hypothetical protein